jgi:hypothetical protein
MPAGLEERVVDAMREHGVLAKRRRTIVVTNSRVAAVLAASVALTIGAYSIGLHRGGRPDVVPFPATAPRESAFEDAGAPRQNAPELARGETGVASEAKKDLAESRAKDMPAASAPSAAADEVFAGRAAEPELQPERDALAKEAPAPAPSSEVASPQSDSRAARAPSAALRSEAAFELPKRTLTFYWDGAVHQIEADSARIDEDERGRILIIYTPDGVVRLRLAD